MLPLPTILMIDDNLGDQQLVQIAMEQTSLQCDLVCAIDGIQGMQLLKDSQSHPGLYQLVIMDLNMPRMNGLDLLAWARAQPWLRSLPITILTSSDLPRDRVQCMDLGATMYLVKPSDFVGYLELCKSLSGYLMAAIGGGANDPLQAQPRR